MSLCGSTGCKATLRGHAAVGLCSGAQPGASQCSMSGRTLLRACRTVSHAFWFYALVCMDRAMLMDALSSRKRARQACGPLHAR
eukprot:4666251-Prymnesium_polylepis.4